MNNPFCVVFLSLGEGKWDASHVTAAVNPFFDMFCNFMNGYVDFCNLMCILAYAF